MVITSDQEEFLKFDVCKNLKFFRFFQNFLEVKEYRELGWA